MRKTHRQANKRIKRAKIELPYGWRWLSPGERTQEGDVIRSDTGTFWAPCHASIGHLVPSGERKFIARKTSPSTADLVFGVEAT